MGPRARVHWCRYRNASTDEPSVRNLNRTVANTALVSHGRKLFALKEDALPIELDPNTLQTRGPWDFGGKYTGRTFTAHPKIDPARVKLPFRLNSQVHGWWTTADDLPPSLFVPCRPAQTEPRFPCTLRNGPD